MKYCPRENFNQLAAAITRIEQHIGLRTATDNETVNGRIYNLVNRFYQDPISGVLYYNDSIRSKWLSVTRTIIPFTLPFTSISTKRYLKFGDVYTSLNGFVVSGESTITSAFVNLKSNATCTFSIIKNKSVNILDIDLINQQSVEYLDLNIDLSKSDELMIFVTPQTPIDYPILSLEIALRRI